jgi:hypothetical protein
MNPVGVEVYAQGYMPMTVYRPGANVTVPIGAVDAAQGGGTTYITVFDFEPPAADPFTFGYDTLAPSDFQVVRSATCDGSTDCNGKWVRNQYDIGIPTNDQGVAFYGGYLTATYQPAADEHVWALRITAGRPFLTK